VPGEEKDEIRVPAGIEVVGINKPFFAFGKEDLVGGKWDRAITKPRDHLRQVPPDIDASFILSRVHEHYLHGLLHLFDMGSMHVQ
jgi:hypothetical protein